MTTSREAILERTRLARMRLGQEVGEYVPVPSMQDGDTPVRFLVVPVTEAELQRGLSYAAMDEGVPESFGAVQYRSRRAVLSDLWHACREPGEPTKRVFESIDEMAESLSPSDIDTLNIVLTTLMYHSSPSMDGMSDEELDFLEEAWRRINLKELSGRPWAAAKVCLSILMPELLQARSYGSTSTSGSTMKNENVESTSAVSPS